jgi:hypothetical protein
MTNRAVELHDSQVLVTNWDGEDLVLRMSVYLHVTEGRPGWDRGTGCTQDADLRVTHGTLIASPHGSLSILDGTIQVEERVFSNILPVPFDHHGRVVVAFKGAEGELHATGTGIALILLGSPVFVEEIPGHDER